MGIFSGVSDAIRPVTSGIGSVGGGLFNGGLDIGFGAVGNILNRVGVVGKGFLGSLGIDFTTIILILGIGLAIFLFK